MKKHFLFTISGLMLLSVNAQAQVQERNLVGLQEGSILMCKDNQCVPTSSEMVRDYLYNQINDLMSANIGQKISFCEADPEQHKCTQKNISFPVYSPTIQTTVKIEQAQLIDAKSVKDTADGVDMIIDYHVRAGDTFPHCQTSLTRVGVASTVDVKMMSPQFNCRLTETGKTTFSIVYNVEYLDMDTGTIGAFYTIAANNALTGSNGGYLLMQMGKGLEMEAGEIFPYPAQLKAIQNGTMPPINDPEVLEKMGAFWLKPTPFLNLTTPVFAPNNCFEFEGGCSAEMLNEPKKAVPPSAEKIAKLIPEGVPATVGLIQQTVTYEDPKEPVMTKTVVSNRQVLEGGKAVFEEKEVKHYIQKTLDSEVLEETEKTIQETTGNKEDIIPAIMMKNAEKEYQSLKQFESQSQEVVAGQVTTVDGKDIQIPARTIEQTQDTSADKTEKDNIQIITPEGVTLSDAERAYIEKIALSEEEIISRLPMNDVLMQEQLPANVVNSNTSNVPVVSQQVVNTPSLNPIPTAKKEETNNNSSVEVKPVVQVSQEENVVQTASVPQIKEVKTVTTTTTVSENTPLEVPVYNVGKTDAQNLEDANLDKNIEEDINIYPLVENSPVILPDDKDVKEDNESAWQKVKNGISKVLYF